MRGGYRRVVASPSIEIIELDANAWLEGFCASVGGGGVPIRSEQKRGVNAVTTGSRTCLLAAGLKADLFVISTEVEKVALNFGKENQKNLDTLTLAEAHQYMAEGHFAAGSMGPKIEAVIEFLERGGPKAIITNPDNIARALNGETGTVIIPG
jgi:carbamate kinase